MGKVLIVGLGAGDLEQLPLGIYRLLEKQSEIWLRTLQHPVVEDLRSLGLTLHSFDDVYETRERFEDVYREIVESLIAAANEQERPLLYAVPGHPSVAERTVQLLLTAEKNGEIETEIAGGQSFLDPLFARLQIDPAEGAAVLDGTALQRDQIHPRQHTIICQVYDAFVASEVKLTLMEVFPDDYPVVVATAVGVKGQEEIREAALYELDRLEGIHQLTLVYVPPTERQDILNRRFHTLRDIVAILRGPDGCPWDREQTHRSIRKHLIEETYEVLETIDEDDPEAMCEELGDLLLQIMLHSQMAEEEGFFTVDDVVSELCEKLIRRHPHVFGEGKARGADQALANWEEIKRKEKEQKGRDTAETSVLDGIPKDLPAVLYAWKLQKKAAKVGFDWDDVKDVFAKIEEEIEEIHHAASDEEKKSEVGDLLFAVVNLARFLHVDPEEALMLTNRKFEKRFTYIEAQLKEQNKTLFDTKLHELEHLWQKAKKS